MNGRRGAVDADALHARLDGRLPPERAAAVDRYVAEHPAERERWSDYAAQRRGLREALTIPPGKPVPERLRVVRLVQRRRRRCPQRGPTDARRADAVAGQTAAAGEKSEPPPPGKPG